MWKGQESLGWGDPASDFFAISVDEAFAGLDRLSSQGGGFWHYRIYDTVSDPSGSLRTWLERLSKQVDQPYPGRDYLRVQYFATENRLFAGQESTPVRFGDTLELIDQPVLVNLNVHEHDRGWETILYVGLMWLTRQSLSVMNTDLSMSHPLV